MSSNNLMMDAYLIKLSLKKIKKKIDQTSEYNNFIFFSLFETRDLV